MRTNNLPKFELSVAPRAVLAFASLMIAVCPAGAEVSGAESPFTNPKASQLAAANFEVKRRTLEDQIASLENRGIKTALHHQALAELDDLWKQQPQSPAIETKISRIKSALLEQTEALDLRDRSDDKAKPAPFQPAKICAPTPVESYCETLNAFLKQHFKAPDSKEPGAKILFTVDADGHISNVVSKVATKGDATKQSLLATYITNLTEIPPPPAGSAPVTLLVTHDSAGPPAVRPDFELHQLTDYKEAALRKMLKCTKMPPGLGDWGLWEVSVSFGLNRKGEVLYRKIEKVGTPSVDEAILRGIEVAAPFGPFPDGAPKEIEVKDTFAILRRDCRNMGPAPRKPKRAVQR